MVTGLFESQGSQALIATKEIEPVAGTTGSFMRDRCAPTDEEYHMPWHEKLCAAFFLILLPIACSIVSIEW